MSTSRAMSGEDSAIGYALSLCKWEYLTIIASLVAGTKAQRAMDIELRKAIVSDMDNVMRSLRDHMGVKG